MTFDRFSVKQNALFAACMTDGFLTLAEGAIRSGKSFSAVWSFVLASQLREQQDRLHLIVGRNLLIMRAELLPTIEAVCKAMGYAYSYNRSNAMITIRETRYLVLAAVDESSYERVRSATIGCALIDEATLIPQSFWDEVIGRLSHANSRLIATCNPKGQHHWLKTEWIDQGKVDRRFRFGLDDNPTLADEVKDRYNSMFSGAFHARNIRGEWVDLDGLVYRAWETTAPCPGGVNMPIHTAIGLDYGISSVTAAVAVCWYADGTAQVVNGLYLDGKASVLTDERIIQALLGWVAENALPNASVWVDPSAVSLINLMRAMGVYGVRSAKNDVLPGISAVNTALACGKLKVTDVPSTQALRDELGTYAWDEKAAQRGVERPVKADDHACDALRYAWYSELSAPSVVMQQAPVGM